MSICDPKTTDTLEEADALRFDLLQARIDAARARLELLGEQDARLREQLVAKYGLDVTLDRIEARTIVRGPRPQPVSPSSDMSPGGDTQAQPPLASVPMPPTA